MKARLRNSCSGGGGFLWFGALFTNSREPYAGGRRGGQTRTEGVKLRSLRGLQAPRQTDGRPSAAQCSTCRGDCAWAESKASFPQSMSRHGRARARRRLPIFVCRWLATGRPCGQRLGGINDLRDE